MSEIIITGASDDLIEIDGKLNEEFTAYDCEDGLLACSDGTLLNVDFDNDGIWRFTPKVKGSSFVLIEQGDAETEENDRVHMKDDLKWIVFSDEPQSTMKPF